MEKFKIELIEWADSSTDPGGWKFTQEGLKDYDKIGFIAKIMSVGYVIYEDEDVITLAANLGKEAFEGEEFEFCSLMRIPKVCVIKRKKFK